VATLNVIRRWALRDQMSIREISRRTGLARNTVKKYLQSEETEPNYEGRVSASKRYPYAEKLATWLGIGLLARPLKLRSRRRWPVVRRKFEDALHIRFGYVPRRARIVQLKQSPRRLHCIRPLALVRPY
jgi:transposase